MSLLTEIILFTLPLFIFSVKVGEAEKAIRADSENYWEDFDSIHINVDYRGQFKLVKFNVFVKENKTL